MTKKFTEAMLFPPVQNRLQQEGFIVQGEVNHCDVVAVREEEMVIVELKKNFNLKLVYQAIDRQSLSKSVYVAIPRPNSGQNTKQWKSMIKLLKRLDLGLMTIALDSPMLLVEVVLEPKNGSFRKNSKRIRKLEKELKERNGDYNIGGIHRRKLITAYRENAIELGCILWNKQQISIQELRELGMDEKQIKILGNNVYGWFYRVKRGSYILSEKGKQDLMSNEFKKVVEFYQKKWLSLQKG